MPEELLRVNLLSSYIKAYLHQGSHKRVNPKERVPIHKAALQTKVCVLGVSVGQDKRHNFLSLLSSLLSLLPCPSFHCSKIKIDTKMYL